MLEVDESGSSKRSLHLKLWRWAKGKLNFHPILLPPILPPILSKLMMRKKAEARKTIMENSTESCVEINFAKCKPDKLSISPT